ncbi:hypothetical protein ACFQH2_00690 [Natronoarchaeum sp. GCM10025703]|uniref:hypothetical protein n=1 Tax=unclassified Natronoarchaeum TaxID=2620183 RepID=UPI0036211237
MTDGREYDKLVRDEIPEIIHKSGETPIVHVADDVEYGERLADKLGEETAEFRESGDLDELADVLEVIRAICRHRDVEFEHIETIREEKASERGGFSDRIVLDAVESPSQESNSTS